MPDNLYRAAVAAVVSLIIIGAGAAAAQDRRQNQPGKFDFYVLSLSWTPTFCQESGERGQNPNQECGTRPHGFVVHGFWPQYESGFPEFCQVPAPRLNRGIVSSMLDLMPAPRLIFREWDRHGTCSGLGPSAYFETIRKARASVKLPEAYLDVNRRLRVSPKEIADAFVKANPGLSPGAISVSCDATRLTEVRMCMSKELGFHDCPDVAQRACRRQQIVMPPSHSERATSDEASPVE